MAEKFAAFLSYAHNDDYDDQVTRFVTRLRAEIRSHLGYDLPFFVDRNDIKWGQNWKQRIDGTLDSATLLIAILSPSFFRSPECQRELEKFRARETRLGRDDLILPVVWIEPDEFTDEGNQLAAFLNERQYERWDDLRHEDPYPPAAKRRVAKLAQQVKATLSRPSAALAIEAGRAHPPAPPASVPTQNAEAGPGALLPGTVRIHAADGLPYVWIPPGEFDMGCSPGDTEAGDSEKPLHRVQLTKGFWIGQTPVTQAAYERVMGKARNLSNFKGAALPMDSVSWDEAAAYCRAVGGRLPAEAEWEYAARAGSKVPRYGHLDTIAWWEGNSGFKNQPVAGKAANAWGLYDTLGNVWEWVEDWFEGEFYKSRPIPDIDPKGPNEGELRVLRGGSWNVLPSGLRVSSRARHQPPLRSPNLGFRCAREAFP